MLSARSPDGSEASYPDDSSAPRYNTYLQDVMFNMQNSPEGDVFELPGTCASPNSHHGPPSELLPTPVFVWSRSSSIYTSKRASRSVPDLAVYTDMDATALQTPPRSAMSPLKHVYPPSMSWLGLLREDDSDDEAEDEAAPDLCDERLPKIRSLSDLRQSKLPGPLSPSRTKSVAERKSQQRSGSIPNRVSQAIALQRTNPDIRRRTRSPPPSPRNQMTPLPDVPTIPRHYLTIPFLSPPISPVTLSPPSPFSPLSPASATSNSTSHPSSYRLSRPFLSTPPPIPVRSQRRPGGLTPPNRDRSPVSASRTSSMADSDFSMSTGPTEWDPSTSPMRVGPVKGFERGIKVIDVGSRSGMAFRTSMRITGYA